MQKVLILGAGIGGAVAASRLRRLLPRCHRVVMVEQASSHIFGPSLPWLMVGERSGRQISRPMTALARHGIELVQGTIEHIDPASRELWGNFPQTYSMVGLVNSATRLSIDWEHAF